MRRIFSLITQHPAWTLLVVLALTAFMGSRIVDVRTGQSKLRFDPSMNQLLPEASEDFAFYEHVRRLFGSDETLLVALVDDDIFTAENLDRIIRLTRRFEQAEGVHHVVSLANALDIRSAEEDLEIENFLAEVPQDAGAIAALRQRALDNPIFAGSLISKDARAAAFMIYLHEIPEREFLERGIDENLLAIANEERGDAQVWMTGPPRIKAETIRAVERDSQRIVPLVVALTALVALLAFRSILGVLLPLATVSLAVVWTLGVVAWLGRPLNLVTSIVPTLVLTIGFAYVVHVLSEYLHFSRSQSDEDSGRNAASQALQSVALPVALTALTTGAGFLALTVSRLSAVREFGVFALVGVLSTLIVSLTFAPAALALLGRSSRTRSVVQDSRFDRFANTLARFDLRQRRWILTAGLVVAVLAVYGMGRIQVSADMIANFDPQAAVRTHFEAINDAFDGSNPFYIVLETDYRDAFKEPVNLHEIENLQTWLEAQPEIGDTTSVADYIKVIHRGFKDDDPSQLVIPESRRFISQLLFFSANDALDSFVDSRYQTTSILIRSRVLGTADVVNLTERIRERLDELPGHLKATVTGNSVLLARTADEVSRGQAESLGIAFLAIYVILAVLFTSPRIGLIALIPNALPVVIYFGALGWTGVSLNPTTGLVACIVLGIAVDDTIHYISRFATEARRRANEADGTSAALRTVGRPVSITTAALVVGFGALAFSSLKNQVHFGALGALTLASAWLIDVTFTPALCSRLRIVSLWDVLTLDLGADPQRSIPVFHHLTKSQARIAALTTSLQRFPKGHRLIREGESGREMYVVIDGELQVSVPRGERRVELASLSRGDVVGEIALFSGKRTADVDALTDVELLCLTRENLERLRRRYPRIGARLFENLSVILAQRLVNTTGKVR